MADNTIDSTAHATSDLFWGNGVWGPYWIDENVGVIIYNETTGVTSNVAARKTTDGGATWGSAITVDSLVVIAFSAWFDRQTPGDMGNKIHVSYMTFIGGGVGVHNYAAFDIVAGTWSTPVTVIGSLATTSTPSSHKSFISKTQSGNIILGGLVSTSLSHAYKASSPYSTWTSISNPFESNANDQVLGISSNSSDTNDSGLLFWDVSANQLSIKRYDDSADSWVETTLTGTFTDVLDYKNMAATTRLSDGHVLIAAWNAHDISSADLVFLRVSLESSAVTIWNPGTDINTNQVESGMASIFVDQTNDDIYVAYGVGGTFESLIDIKYKKSTDGGSTWGAAQQYSDVAVQDDYRLIGFSAMGTNGGRFQPVWFDDDDADLYNNLDNDIPITRQRLLLPLISSAAVNYGMTLTPGPVSITMPYLSSAAAIYAIALQAVLTLPTINSVEALYTFELEQLGYLGFPYLVNTSDLYAPTLTPGAIAILMGFLDSTSALYTPLISPDQELLTSLLINSQLMYAPTLTPGAVALLLSLLTNANTLYAPTITPGTVTLLTAHLGNISQLYGFNLVREGLIDFPLLQNTNVLYGFILQILTDYNLIPRAGILRDNARLAKEVNTPAAQTIRSETPAIYARSNDKPQIKH